MDVLLARLTNFSYELFGVFIPGLIASIFLIMLWAALGPAVPCLTYNIIPEFSLKFVYAIFKNPIGSVGSLIIFSILFYFVGHIILWIGRSGKPEELNALGRVLSCIFFKIPKPVDNYDPALSALFAASANKFSQSGQTLTWRELNRPGCIRYF
jgi:hypothetical protein